MKDFLFLFVFAVLGLMLGCTGLAIRGAITPTTLILAWVFTPIALLVVFDLVERLPRLPRIGAFTLAVTTFSLAFAATHHAHAQTLAGIAAPAGDTGFWTGLNGWIADGLGAVVTACVGWVCTLLAAHTRIKIRADQEAQIRETMKTGAFKVAHDLELEIDQHWTPAQRQKVVDGVVSWVEIRAQAQMSKLGIPGFVATAMARKVVGQLRDEILALGLGDIVDASAITGNLGETPALDRATGSSAR